MTWLNQLGWVQLDPDHLGVLAGAAERLGRVQAGREGRGVLARDADEGADLRVLRGREVRPVIGGRVAAVGGAGGRTAGR